MDVTTAPYLLLEDLLLRPELLLPPPVVIPRLAWQSRVTLFAAREKLGKSTLMGQAVARLSSGPKSFLEDDIETPGKTLWIGLDEPLPDIVRRLAFHGAESGVALMTERPGVDQLVQAVERFGASLVVVDTLLEFVSGFVDDANSPTQIQPILKMFRDIAQRTRAAFVILHHAAKGSGDYRDSTQIGAGVDALVVMKEDSEDPNLRKCVCRGRVPNSDFRLAYIGGIYQIAESKAPLALQVQRVIQQSPGCSAREVIRQVGCRTQDVLEALRDIAGKGLIEDRGSGNRQAWYTKVHVSGDVKVETHGNGRR